MPGQGVGCANAAFHDGPQPKVEVSYEACGSDLEGQPKEFSFDDQSIRLGFIRKVYMILMGQLLVTFGTVALFVYSQDAKDYANRNPWLFWVAVGLMFATMLGMVCCETVSRQIPTNFIFLGIFTLAESFLLGIAASHFEAKGVLLAIGITVFICLGLTLFAMQTTYDFTMMGGFLLSCLMALFIFGFLAVFVGGSIAALIYSSLSALLFCFYLVYDTQLMMGGKHKYAINPEEYIFATLSLYLDIINIFLDILNILGIVQD